MVKNTCENFIYLTLHQMVQYIWLLLSTKVLKKSRIQIIKIEYILGSDFFL
jgi:hypothetical protein